MEQDKNSNALQRGGDKDSLLTRWNTLSGNRKKHRQSICLRAGCARVCKNTVESTGPLTAWMQQWWALKDRGVKKSDPRH
eukprot:8691125-Ditylum_brightwellii.AAC.1